jgi:TIR domain
VLPPVKIFFSYAHEDYQLMDAVRIQLVGADRRGLIVKWYDRRIMPGDKWKGVIAEQLGTADIILLFISAHFIASDYAYEIEMAEALKRHEAGQARVIPIIVSPCQWEAEPFAHLQVLPTGARALNTWPNLSEATNDVAAGIMAVVNQLLSDPEAPDRQLS